MEPSDYIYILKDLYNFNGIDRKELNKICVNLNSVDNKLKLVRYKVMGEDKWLNLDVESPEKLKDIDNPVTIWGRPDLSHLQTSYENEFLKKYIDKVGYYHNLIQEIEFYEKVPLLKKAKQVFDDALEIDSEYSVFTIFNWASPEYSGWHIDGATTYAISKVPPTKITINLPFDTESYIELKRNNGEIVNNKDYRENLVMINHRERTHRINLNGSKRRLTLLYRIRELNFDDVVKQLEYKNLILCKL